MPEDGDHIGTAPAAVSSHTLRISFPKAQLEFVGPLLEARGIEVGDGAPGAVLPASVTGRREGDPDEPMVGVAVESHKVDDFLFELYSAQTACYNIEQWVRLL